MKNVTLPEFLTADTESLRQYILELANKHNAIEEINANLVKENTSLTQDKQSLTKENEIKYNKILKLELIIFDFRRKIFGNKSEKIDPSDLYFGFLFNEAEKGINDEEKIFDGNSETIHVKSFARKKTGRKPLPENLPKEEIIHDIPESEKTCNCGHELKRIGEEVSDKLGYIPAKIYLERHIRFKYACKHCEGDERDEAGKIVVTAEMPPQLLPKSYLTPELLAYILISKFLDHIPFYRMESIFLRHGLEITRATLCNWTIGVYERYHDFFSFFDKLLSARIRLTLCYECPILASLGRSDMGGCLELMKRPYKFTEN